MCGRYLLVTEDESPDMKLILNELTMQYEAEPDTLCLKSGEIFPTDAVPVITGIENGRMVVELFKWGFPNFYQRSGVIINARCETLDEKPTFRELLTSKRCLVPANGFFEWKSEGKNKQKYLIRSEKKRVFYMAGLYNTFKDKSGNVFNAFVIITTNACKDMAGLHDRMPAVLEGKAARLWLQKGLNNSEALKNLLVPYESSLSLQMLE